MVSRLRRLPGYSALMRRGHVGLFFLGCLGTLALLAFLLASAYWEADKQAASLARNTVDVLEAQVSATLRRLEGDLEQIAATVPREALEQEAVERFHDQLTGILLLHARNFPEIVGYRILDASGNVLYTSQPDLPRASAQGRAYFEDMKANPRRGLVFSAVAMGRMTPRPLVFAALPIRAETGRFLGLVMAPIDLESLQRLFRTIDLGRSGVIALRRADDGRLVLRQPALPGAVNQFMVDNPMHRAVEAGDQGGMVRWVAPIDGIERTYAFRRVGDYPFYLVTGIATYDYLDNWRTTAAAVLFVSFAFLLALGGVMWRLHRLASKEKELAGQLKKREALYRKLLEAAPFPIVIAGLNDARMRYLNQRAAQWLGAGCQDFLGHSARELYPEPATRDRLVARLKGEGEVRDAEVELHHHQVGRRWALVSMDLIEFDGETCTFAAFSDISARKAAEQEKSEANATLQLQLDEIRRLQAALRDQAIRDGLTGLFNRRYLDETLEREVARARREGWPLSLILLDIDHFKAINDTCGHQAGDQVLKAVAGCLTADVRAEDVACRYGGEEFLILLPGMPLAAAVDRAREWRRSLAELPIPCGGRELQVTASFGVAAFPDHAATPDQLTQCADRALYGAKGSGRNRVEVFQASSEPEPLSA